MEESKKELALGTLDDLAVDYLYYDRRNDDELGKQDMADLITSGDLTSEEIIDRFAQAIKRAIAENFIVKKPRKLKVEWTREVAEFCGAEYKEQDGE